MTTGKTVALTRQSTLLGKVMSLLFIMLSRLVITFVPRSKLFCFFFLISWLQSPCAVIFEPPKIKSNTVSTFSPSICHGVTGLDAMIFVFWMLSCKPTFYSPLSSRGFLVPLHFLPEVWCHLYIWGYWYFSQQSSDTQIPCFIFPEDFFFSDLDLGF